MKEVNVLILQSLFDISVQHTGDIANVFDIALANNLEMISDLEVNQKLIIPDTVTVATKELQYFNARKIIPATGLAEKRFGLGIGFMRVGKTFIVGESIWEGVGTMAVETSFIVEAV